MLIAPVDGIVLGMTTHPAVRPGQPVCHLAVPGRGVNAIRRKLAKAPDQSPEHRTRSELATSITVERI